MTSHKATSVAAAYFEAWKARDFVRFRSLLADDVSFIGPLGRADYADEYVQGIEALSRIVSDIVIHKTFVDGDDVVTWFDLHTSVTPPMAVANWMHVANGKITRVRVTFDPRPLSPPAA